MDVLAMNPLAAALYGGLEYMDNLLRLAFLNPAAREFYRDWEKDRPFQGGPPARRRGSGPRRPVLTELVDELSRESADFRRLWARHDVSEVPGSQRFHHREVGDLFTPMEVLTVDSAPGQQLLVFQAEPGSPSEAALALLNSRTRHDVWYHRSWNPPRT